MQTPPFGRRFGIQIGWLLLSTLLAPSAVADTFFVNDWTDTSDGVCNSQCSLREAVQAANANPGADEIRLFNSTFALTRGEDGALSVTSRIVIRGFNARIDASALMPRDRVFDVGPGGDLELHDLWISGGSVHGGDGGGIRNTSGKVLLDNVVVAGNSSFRDGSGGRGGGIHSGGSGNEVIVRDSLFEDNTCGIAGCALFTAGGRATITDTGIAGNVSLDDSAGIWTASETVVQRSYIVNNRAKNAVVSVYVTGGSFDAENLFIQSGSSLAAVRQQDGSTRLVNTDISASSFALQVTGGQAPQLGNVSIFGRCEGPADSLGGNVEHGGDTCSLDQGADRPNAPEFYPADLAGWPVVDAGVESLCPAEDADGVLRPLDGDQDGTRRCDAGATEFDPCDFDSGLLCIDDVPGDRRFTVRADYRTAAEEGIGLATSMDEIGVPRGGVFAFFSFDNPELLVKVLNACVPPFNSYWVFMSAGTDQGFEVTVTDTATGAERVYTNPLGRLAPPVADVSAFPCVSANSLWTGRSELATRQDPQELAAQDVGAHIDAHRRNVWSSARSVHQR